MQMQQKAAILHDVSSMLAELLRLPMLDGSLSTERKFVATLDEGVKHALQGKQYDAAGMWLHGKLMSSSEEGQQVDRALLIKELSGVAKFITVPRARAEAPCRGVGPLCNRSL
ncbi:unnamed protein product [Ectocarpus sp. CCAP 1310/34]|nr:unnamed protein product [Ectocarpus sp. CCAP 1310/34]